MSRVDNTQVDKPHKRSKRMLGLLIWRWLIQGLEEIEQERNAKMGKYD
jgi:hypothetical protein